jgi:alkane 1-monooxygenase
LFFALQSAIAITVLELFNYIAHYGLMRRERDQGLEPLGDAHSWNSSNALANLVIFNMGRHSDHHRHPANSYETLRPIGNAPELPAGYAGSILLALAPPLWHRLMDAELDSLAHAGLRTQAASSG